jgi:phage-related protein
VRHDAADLGVVTSPLPAALSAQLELKSGEGLLVLGVLPDSPAAAGGVRKHDVLLAVGEEKLTARQSLHECLAGRKAGERVSLTLVRGGKKTAATVQLTERAPQRSGLQQQIIEIDGNGAVRIELTFTDEAGTRHETTIKGTLAESRREARALPAAVSKRVAGQLDAIADSEQPPIRFRLQPVKSGDRKAVRVILSSRGQGRAARIFELDVPVSNKRPFELAQLLGDESLKKELQRLTPEVRRRIEETLKRVDRQGEKLQQKR